MTVASPGREPARSRRAALRRSRRWKASGGMPNESAKPSISVLLGHSRHQAELGDRHRSIEVLAQERLGLPGGAVARGRGEARVGSHHVGEPRVQDPVVPGPAVLGMTEAIGLIEPLVEQVHQATIELRPARSSARRARRSGDRRSKYAGPSIARASSSNRGAWMCNGDLVIAGDAAKIEVIPGSDQHCLMLGHPGAPRRNTGADR